MSFEFWNTLIGFGNIFYNYLYSLLFFLLITIGEVIPMVLTIYMGDPNLPLPSRIEVLLCTDHTTKEEVVSN